MKAIFLLIFCFFSSKTFAFLPEVDCYEDELEAECYVCNEMYNTIECRGQIEATTESGEIIISYINKVTLLPNAHKLVKIQAKESSNPITKIEPKISCTQF